MAERDERDERDVRPEQWSTIGKHRPARLESCLMRGI